VRVGPCTYRVWEAARKVFLYPENSIEPELRDDKSPFFEELEKEIAQGDLNTDRAEDTLLSYLDRLHEVSGLQVLASHVQRESDADGTIIDLLHVFARTRSLPTVSFRSLFLFGAIDIPGGVPDTPPPIPDTQGVQCRRDSE